MVKPEELSEREVEVWVKTIDGQSYRHFRTGEIANTSELKVRESLNRMIIRLYFVDGKTIL